MSESEYKNKPKDYLYLGLIFIVIIIGCSFAWIYLHDPETQFNYVKEQIESIKFECIEGFNGIEYGYTGEIAYRHGLFDGLGVVGFENNLTDEQIETLTQMLLNKASMLPCYDKYLELGNEQGITKSRNGE